MLGHHTLNVENNPIMLIDPNGREVRISGSEKKSAYKQLRKALKREGIKLSWEKTASGYVLNYSEKSKGANYSQGVSTLLSAMADDNIDLDIHAVVSAVIDYDKEANYVNPSNGGSFMGSNYSAGDDCATTTQLVVPETPKTMESLASFVNGSSM